MNKNFAPILMVIISIALWLIFYPELPNQVPMQWGADGSVNWHASKLTALLVNNGMFVFIYLILYLVPKFDPKKKNYQQFSRSYNIIYHSILILFFTINIIVLFTSLGYSLKIEFFIPVIAGLSFIVLGNYMQTVKPNWFIGIRTPWTLENDQVWRKTHRLGSKLFIIAGVIMIIVPFLPDAFAFPMIIIVSSIAALVPIVYSYILYRKLK